MAAATVARKKRQVVCRRRDVLTNTRPLRVNCLTGFARQQSATGLAWVCGHPFTAIAGGHNVTATEFPLRHLPAYSRDELTCLGYIIVARKQSQRDENA